MSFGYNEIDWDGTDDNEKPVANGIYFYKIIADNGPDQVTTTGKAVKMQ